MGRTPVRILIIEDEETDYLLTRRMLSSIGSQSYEVQWADSWGTGIEAIRRCAHDVCLLDFRIGGGDGLELLKESREIGCKAPVILLTGVGDHNLDVEAMGLGAADFLVKDRLTPELLERSIRYALTQAESLNELERQRDALRASELRLRSVVQSAPDAIILADENTKIIGWNRGAEEIFGYTEEEIVGAHVEILMPEHLREVHRAGFERMRVTGRSQMIGNTLELDGLRKNGTIFPMELSLASWRDGASIMFTCIVRDITDRRRTEELRNAKEAAEEANVAKSRFVASMSHELRTPLHAIIGFTNLMLQNRESSLTTQDRDFLERIALNAKHQLQLINGVLDLSRIEAGKMELQLEEVTVDNLLNDLVRQIEGERRNPQVQIIVQVPQFSTPIQTDPARLKQILLNLVDNALKFTPNGTVTISVDIHPMHYRPVRIDVTDTGVGIAPEQVSEIFEPFRQLEGAPRRTEGSGLGLSICRSLADLLGYRLQVKSAPGSGSTFSILLEAEAHQLPLTA